MSRGIHNPPGAIAPEVILHTRPSAAALRRVGGDAPAAIVAHGPPRSVRLLAPSSPVAGSSGWVEVRRNIALNVLINDPQKIFELRQLVPLAVKLLKPNRKLIQLGCGA